MRIDSINSQETNPKGPHADYEKNLSKANAFITNIQKSLLPGLGVKLAGKISTEDGLKNTIVEISWRTPTDIYLGNCCYSVSLHQDHNKFCTEIERKFSEYHKSVKSYWDSKQVTQATIPLTKIDEKASKTAQDRFAWLDR